MPDIGGILLNLPSVLVILARLGGFFATAPIFSSRYIPVQVKTCLVLYLSCALAPVVSIQPVDGVMRLAGVMFVEVLVGMAAGYVASLIFLAVQVAGQVADQEMGFGMVNVFDPMHGNPIPLMGSFLYLLALMLYLAIDGHHFLVASLIRSYERIPAGQIAGAHKMAEMVLARMQGAFVLGVQIISPVLVALFLATVAMGIMARTVPQINVFIMGLPVKVLVGASVVCLSLPVFTSVCINMFQSSFVWLSQFLELIAP